MHVNQHPCSLASLPVSAGNQALKSCHAEKWLSPDTDASRGWSYCHYGLFRVTVTPSSTLEEMPRPRDLQSVACLGLSLPFHSTATAGVLASQLPQPGVINVVLIFQTPASPFYLNLIKVASCLWPASLMSECELATQPASQPASRDLHYVSTYK